MASNEAKKEGGTIFPVMRKAASSAGFHEKNGNQPAIASTFG